MKKIIALLALALVAAPAFAQQNDRLEKNVKRAIVSAQLDFGEESSFQSSVLNTVNEARNGVSEANAENVGVIFAHLSKLASWYEQTRNNNEKSVLKVAGLLSEYEFNTKDGQHFTAYSFVQMHMNEIMSNDKVKNELKNELGWKDEYVAAQAYGLMNLMSDWKDHLRDDAARYMRM